jgi:hypothetical protein
MTRETSPALGFDFFDEKRLLFFSNYIATFNFIKITVLSGAINGRMKRGSFHDVCAIWKKPPGRNMRHKSVGDVPHTQTLPACGNQTTKSRHVRSVAPDSLHIPRHLFDKLLIPPFRPPSLIGPEISDPRSSTTLRKKRSYIPLLAISPHSGRAPIFSTIAVD